MTIEEMIEVLQAYKNDDELEVNMDCGWKTAPLHPMWNFEKYEYRAKPKTMEIYVNVYKVDDDGGVAFGGARSTLDSSEDARTGKCRIVKFIEVIE